MTAKSILTTVVFGAVLIATSNQSWAETSSQASPKCNILFAIADDWGVHAGAYGTPWTRTPTIDRLAKDGLLFRNAFTPMAKCAPSRAIILTGRHLWQNEEAGNHLAFFPPSLTTWPEVLSKHGWQVGITGKGWAPGIAQDAVGNPREMIGRGFNRRKAEPPTTEISNNDYAANFADFLDTKDPEQPWCFWFGAAEPHRRYEAGSGERLLGIDPSAIDRVPEVWPDDPIVRQDMLDYAAEVKHFDDHLARMLDELEQRGLLETTLVIVTSDHGMPFPRAKGYAYPLSNHVPLVVHLPKSLGVSSRRIDDFVDFTDIAPTILEIAGIAWADSGMKPFAGRSWLPLFTSDKSGQIDIQRDHVLVGKERTDVGRPHDQGYPIRGMVTKEHWFLKNYEPSRWPAGNPETGYLDTDGSPTKSLILERGRRERADAFWQLNFGKRPQYELYDRLQDPDCAHNLAESSERQSSLLALEKRLEKALRDQEDPRMLGNGVVFDSYLPASHAGFYEKYVRGEKLNAGWVEPTDFEPHLLEQ